MRCQRLESTLQPGYKIERVLTATGDGPLFGLVRAFIKPREPETFEIVNEYVCARLAHTIGVPCPPGDFSIVSEPNEIAWVSPLALQETPPPANPEDIHESNPSLCAGILAFDTWVLNLDRHDWNIIHSANSGTWIIDHGQTLFYRGDDPATALGSTKNQQMTARHLLAASTSEDDLLTWCKRIATVDDGAIWASIHPVLTRGLIDEEHAGALFDFLEYRARNIAALVPEGLLPEDHSSEGGEES